MSIKGITTSSAGFIRVSTYNFIKDDLTWQNALEFNLGTSGFYINGENRLPSAPVTDGNFTLQCTVSDGTPSYNWRGVVKGETVRNLGGVQTYTITLPVNLSSSSNVYRVLKGCLCLGDLETACFEITYVQRPNNNISVPNVSFMSNSLTMTYSREDRTITFSSTTKLFYACIYSVQEIENFLGLPLTFA